MPTRHKDPPIYGPNREQRSLCGHILPRCPLPGYQVIDEHVARRIITHWFPPPHDHDLPLGARHLAIQGQPVGVARHRINPLPAPGLQVKHRQPKTWRASWFGLTPRPGGALDQAGHLASIPVLFPVAVVLRATEKAAPGVANGGSSPVGEEVYPGQTF
uniref:Uncharacterized protein n=1 Tax=Opuntia streptacantha TaxID=393608 RepID=A0A7C9F845_OPUST